MGSTGDRLMRHKDELVRRLLGPVILVLIRASTSGSADLGLPGQKYATRKAVGPITGGIEQPVNTLIPKPYLEELLVTEDAALRLTGVLGCSMCARL
jgi:hypothetical protein